MSDDVLRMLGRIEEKLDHHFDRLERHDHAIFGNGKEGLIVRTDRTARQLNELRKSRKVVWSAVVSVAGAIGTAIWTLLTSAKH